MLTDAKIKKAKAADKPFRLSDGAGLYLRIGATGVKSWQYRYEMNGKESVLTIGTYPEISLADARAARDKAKTEIGTGRNPAALKKLAKLSPMASGENTFEVIAREWHALQKQHWAQTHSSDVITSLEKEVFPYLKGTLITQITAPDVLAILRAVEARGAGETARRVRQRMSAVFVFAIATGRGTGDPAAIVQKALAPIHKGRQPAITDLDGARAMLRAVDNTPGHPVTKLAIRILALTAVRPGTLANTPWSEWDDDTLEGGMWRISSLRMKMKQQFKGDEGRDHIAPLATQAVEAIHALRQLTGRAIWAFPNVRHGHKPMSENAMGYMLNRAGYHHKHVPHGFRATFSSIMNKHFMEDRAIIDLMLAHVPKDKVEAAYNRELHLSRRAELAQIWADMLLQDAPPAAELLKGPKRINKA